MSGPIWCHDQGEDAKTIFICQNYLHCVPKCNHFEKHHQNVYVCLSLFQGCTGSRHCHHGSLQAPEQDHVLQYSRPPRLVAPRSKFRSSERTLANSLEQEKRKGNFSL
ncbi:hypothetical protein LEMLEM_LOCUS24599 [Lemmus lemmus]